MLCSWLCDRVWCRSEVEAATAKRKELDMQMKRLQERNRYVHT